MTDLRKSREFIMKNFIIVRKKDINEFRQVLIAKDHTSTGKWIKKHFELIFGEK